MRRIRVTITLKESFLKSLDSLTDMRQIRSRSQAVEYILGEYFRDKIELAVILAGGKGTKLRPYTYEIPKSLFPINGKPILEYTINNLISGGIKQIIICTGYLGDKIQNYFGDGSRFSVKIIYSHENNPLRTGGALLNARDKIGERSFLLVNGDIITNLDFKDIINFYLKEKTLVSVGLTMVEKPQKFGQLQIHGNRLIDFQQQSKEKIISHLVNAGIYICSRHVFDYFPKDKKIFFFESVLKNLTEHRQINGFIFNGLWFDIEDPANYERAIKAFKKIAV